MLRTTSAMFASRLFTPLASALKNPSLPSSRIRAVKSPSIAFATIACTSASVATSCVRSTHCTTVPTRLPAASLTGLMTARKVATPIFRSTVCVPARPARKPLCSEGIC